MQESALGNAILAERLSKVRAAVEKEGELTEEAIKTLFVGEKPNSLSERLNELRKRVVDNPEQLETSVLRASHREQVLRFIDRQLSLIDWQESQCKEREKKEESARQAADVLPSIKMLDKIMRYETKLERQLYRAMAQLERLQRMRGGEAVPPPLTMEVSERE